MGRTVNPLRLLPAKARAAVYVAALIIGLVVPLLIADLPTAWQHGLQALAAVAALFASGQGLSNLTPDRENPSLQVARRAIGVNDPLAEDSDIDMFNTGDDEASAVTDVDASI